MSNTITIRITLAQQTIDAFDATAVGIIDIGECIADAVRQYLEDTRIEGGAPDKHEPDDEHVDLELNLDLDEDEDQATPPAPPAPQFPFEVRCPACLVLNRLHAAPVGTQRIQCGKCKFDLTSAAQGNS